MPWHAFLYSTLLLCSTSVLSLASAGVNLTGEIPEHFFTSLVDLQTLTLDNNLVCYAHHHQTICEHQDAS